MTKTIHAVYENGVFRPTEKVDLPDPCEVEVEVRFLSETPTIPSLDDVYAILGRRHSSGEHDLAERHNEHQP
jgi:predicted DNA-binding antitoxin AbrB/MazE fold protein